jgi:hypothetical protein
MVTFVGAVPLSSATSSKGEITITSRVVGGSIRLMFNPFDGRWLFSTHENGDGDPAKGVLF